MKAMKISLSPFLVFSFCAVSTAIAEIKTYRSYSGGSEAAQPKVIRSVDDAKVYKEEFVENETRARPIYEELNEDSTDSDTKEIKKKVYVSRSGSAMARPKIIVQR